MQSMPKIPLTLAEDMRRQGIRREAQDVFNSSKSSFQVVLMFTVGFDAEVRKNAVAFDAKVRSHSRQEINHIRMQEISIFLSSD